MKDEGWNREGREERECFIFRHRLAQIYLIILRQKSK